MFAKWKLNKRDVKHPNNFLVFGNDPFINQMDFSMVKECKNTTTVGVNRIWHRFLPDIFFFIDPEIITELMNAIVPCSKNKKCHPSQICRCNLKKKIIFTSGKRFSHKFSKEIRFMSTIGVKIADCKTSNSVVSVLYYLFNMFPNANYFLAGVSLKWSDKHHFWKKTKEILNDKGKTWYEPRFNKALNEIYNLHKSGLKLASLQPDSMVNHFCQYIELNHFFEVMIGRPIKKNILEDYMLIDGGLTVDQFEKNQAELKRNEQLLEIFEKHLPQRDDTDVKEEPVEIDLAELQRVLRENIKNIAYENLHIKEEIAT